jgi:iron complex outermembrane receptor protein
VSYEFRTEDPIIEGAVSIPLTHNLSIRLAARAEDMQGGYAQNGARSLASDPIPGWGGVPLTGAVTGVYPQTKQLVGRFTAVYTPTSDFTATLKAFASTQRLINPYGDVTLTHCQAAGNHPSFVDEITGQVYIDTTETCSAPPTRTYYNEALPSTACVGMVNAPRDCIPFEQDTNFLGSLKLKYTTGAFTLTSVTGAYKLIAQQFNDSNITVYAGAPDRQNVSSYQLSQEFRVSTDFKFPVNFTAGAFFEHEYMTLMNTNIIFPLGAYPVPGPYFGITNTDLEHDRDTDDDYSFFIQASWKILANLELAGGARWTIAHKEASLYEDFSALDAFTTPATNPLAPAGTLYNPKGAYHNVSPEVTLTWHPVWNVTTYAAYKTGFLAGGIGNPGVMSNYTLLTPAEQNGQLTYQPETVRGYEGGIKGTFFGGRLSGDVDAFHYTYYDLQVATFHTATTTFTIGNAASAINEGVELQGTFRVTDDLAVHGSMTYADLHFSQYPNAPCYSGQVTPSCLSNGQQNLSGAAYGTTGPWSGAIGFTYDRPVTETWSVGLASDLRMYSRSPLQNTQPYTATAAHNLLDASLRFYQPHGRWEVALIATNLTNEYYLTNIENLPLGSPGDFEGYFNPPREIRLQLTSRF